MTARQQVGHKPATTPGEGCDSCERNGANRGTAITSATHWLSSPVGPETAGRCCRTLDLDDAQHAQLTERVKVAADALQLRPEIRRVNGCTQIRVGPPDSSGLTVGEVTLAARIEDMYRTITDDA